MADPQPSSPRRQQQKQRERPNSLGPPLQTPSGPFNSLAPNNDWAYRDRGLPPEKIPTKESVTTKDQSGNASPVSGVSEDEDYVLEDLKPNIYRTYAGRRRAKVPDKEDDLTVVAGTDGDGAQTNGTLNVPQQQQNGASTGRRQSLWEEVKAATKAASGKKAGEETKLRHVMLHWGKEEIRGLEKVVLNARVPQANVRSQIESQNYVSWQHSQLERMTLKKVEDLVSKAKIQGVQESEIGLTRRLLKRVRLESERSFVGGKFLTPRAVRYDSLDNSKYSADKCCIFLAFPYFAVSKKPTRRPFMRGGLEHPVRTLLQSVYRLNDTVERDQTQCIRMLTRKNLKSCIEADEKDKAEVSPKVKEELILVPQLWALILGLDRLMTLGSISDGSLRGRDIEVKEETPSVSKKRCSLVRIRFNNQKRVEDLTYPIEQCQTWFGLVNKQQQLRGVLTKDREVSDPRKYRLQVHGHVIEASTWASIQKKTNCEVLDLWMETPKQRGPKLKVDSPKVSVPPAMGTERRGSVQSLAGADGASGGSSSTAAAAAAAAMKSDDEDEEEDGIKDGTTATSSITFDRIEKVPVVSPFLEWQVIDESGDKDACPPLERVNRFINLIYRNLPAGVGHTTDGFANAKTTIPLPTTPQVAAAKKKPSIAAKTPNDAIQALIQVTANKSKEHLEVAQQVNALFSKVRDAFLPDNYMPHSDPMKLFWGALTEIISRGSQLYLTDLLNRIDIIHAWAEHIHLGVYYKHIDAGPGGREVEKDAISESAILLSSMVDAFGAIFGLLVEAVGDVMGDPKQEQCGKKAVEAFNEAQSKLETARDELIVEASGVAAGEHIGPVVTPEAILILHMERLVCGVYRAGNVDIISILEECLERLALKVRYRYSRRLLQMINAFEEEVAVVHDVLLQQKRVLVEFRGYLKPSSFDTPSIARKMRFDFEEKGIERILITLREQLKNCAELQERAKVLAVQNVHLVETLQDDNGRAIFIFTFITVLFLPLSFIAGFFGMNLVGISGTTHKTALFWKIAIPVTGLIMLLCFAIIIWGERVWFGIASIPRVCAKMYRKRSK